MNTDDLIRGVQTATFLSGIAAIVYAAFKSQTTREIIKQQSELIEAQKQRLDLLEKQHIENAQAIGQLQGEISAYKKIPLENIAKSIKQIAETNKQILQLVKEK